MRIILIVVGFLVWIIGAAIGKPALGMYTQALSSFLLSKVPT